MDFTPQQAILTLGDAFYDRVVAADFPETRLRFRNQRWAEAVGLGGLTDAQWIAHFGRFQPLAGSLETPLALRYHGHQFRVYNPEIGDGRGFVFAQLRDSEGRLLDLGTKGSGQTPWSRFGDGRLTLKGGLREILATEMLEALGVNTSKSFSLIETGEELHRGDEPSPTRSAVLVRLSHGHIRIGTFQRLAHSQDAEAMRALTNYVLRNLHGEEPGPDPAVQLLRNVAARTAGLAGQYMAAGFVHGVLNSDNINVTGESFDYGPWRFTPTWDPGFTAAYFDQTGLYAYGRQPEAIHWDTMQLAVALRLIAEEAPLIEALETFGDIFRGAVADAVLWRFGVLPRDDQANSRFLQALDVPMRETQTPVDRFMFDSFGGAIPLVYGEAFDDVRAQLASFTPRKTRDHPYWHGTAPCSMLIDEVEAIWAPIAEADDWSVFEAKVAQIRQMGEALA
jgi:uncharacterized protein YdiU (UPF0061 family)